MPPIPEKTKILSDCIDAKINILSEKPLVLTSKEADYLANKCDKKNIFAMCYNWRNTYLIRKISDIIKNKTYGNIKKIKAFHSFPGNYTNPDSWYTKIGFLLEHNIHDINYLRNLNGEIKDLKAEAKGDIINPSLMNLELIYENNVNANVQLTNGTRISKIIIECFFEKGIVIGTNTEYNPDFDNKETHYFRILGPNGEIYSKPEYNDYRKLEGQGVNEGISHTKIINNKFNK